jgi:hypothetical protein
MFLFIAHARRRIDTAASSEKLGLYIFYPLLNKFFEASFCFPYRVPDIALFVIPVFIINVRQDKAVYRVIGDVVFFRMLFFS